MSERTFSDTDLHAYLDGEMALEERPEFEAWVAQDPERRRALDLYRADRDRIRRALGPVRGEAVPERLLAPMLAAAGRTGAAWRRTAAAALIFVGGLAAGLGLAGSRAPGPAGAEPGLVARAIGAHRVYAPEIRHPVEVEADQEAHLVAWLSKRLGQPLAAPDLSDQGYRLVGGRLLPDGAEAAAQFMFEHDDGTRLTLYVARNPGGERTAFRLARRDGVRSFYWLDGALAFALSGPVDRSRLLRAATRVYDQIGG